MVITTERLCSFENSFVRGDDDECWNWLEAVFKGPGYGQLSFGGYAHRFAWIVAYGPIPDGLHVLHSCDNRLCVNPAHLFLGTNLDNIKDKVRKGRQKPGSFGEQSNLSTLTEEQVREIRKRHRPYAPGRWGNSKQLAAEFGVTRGCIEGIVQRRNWKHVT